MVNATPDEWHFEDWQLIAIGLWGQVYGTRARFDRYDDRGYRLLLGSRRGWAVHYHVSIAFRWVKRRCYGYCSSIRKASREQAQKLDRDCNRQREYVSNFDTHLGVAVSISWSPVHCSCKAHTLSIESDPWDRPTCCNWWSAPLDR